MWKSSMLAMLLFGASAPYALAGETSNPPANTAPRKLSVMETMTRTVIRKYVRSRVVVPLVGTSRPAPGLAVDD